MHTTSLSEGWGFGDDGGSASSARSAGPQVGTVVGMDVDGERLVIQSQKRPRYTLQELLSECDAKAPMTAEYREWLDAVPVGDEL